MRAIAVVTARGGSKGVVRKNLRQVGGVSLVGRAIRAALETGSFACVALTTDCPEIAAEGAHHGARVIERPAHLANDTARSIDAVLDTLQQLRGEGEEFDCCVLLQPTSPLRTAAHISAALDVFSRQAEGCVFSVCLCEHHPYKTLLLHGGQLMPTGAAAFLEAPRQQLPRAFRPNGAVYVNRVADLFATRTFFVAPLNYVEMDAESSLDIDSEADLARANILCGEQSYAS